MNCSWKTPLVEKYLHNQYLQTWLAIHLRSRTTEYVVVALKRSSWCCWWCRDVVLVLFPASSAAAATAATIMTKMMILQHSHDRARADCMMMMISLVLLLSGWCLDGSTILIKKWGVQKTRVSGDWPKESMFWIVVGALPLSWYEQDLRRKTRRRETSNGRGRVRYLTPRPALFNLLWFRCSTLDYEQVQTIAMWCTRGHVSTRVSWHRRMVSMTQSINPSLDPRHGLPPNAPPRFPAYMPIYLHSPAEMMLYIRKSSIHHSISAGFPPCRCV